MKFLEPAPKSLGFASPVTLIATWFGAGLLRPAAGTWGSLAALPFAWLLLELGDGALLIFATLVVFAAGLWAAGEFERAGDGKDPSSVVVDEVAGQWLALLFVPMSPIGFLVGFALFRFFDVLKIWPVSYADQHLKGGLGIMADDILAGLYAGLAAIVIFSILP